ncbi:hypothetical protein WH96_01185 [Kiloniella spongiae]|uniref:DUF6602 domain-containing protein n=1 Tax=Kiloniella spongiae TaxID=1489064 RepID=A0A0H2MN16_9PROT|nr:DUF6602 domain-containing protein [Kiloniella spongiae]KLN62177.1 hypothetical protein WH96_01185 [Kiloniella spongiae]
MFYQELLENISSDFKSKFNAIEAEHNFDSGPEFEIALCEVLQTYLPNKLGVCRGFIMNSIGECAGDDIIIYDKSTHPTLRNLGHDNFSRKQKIPVEAVYAYIEAKNTLYLKGSNRNNLIDTLKQINKVRLLLESRAPLKLNTFNGATLNGFEVSSKPGWPNIKNPPFTTIWARQVKLEKSSNPILEYTDILKYTHESLAEEITRRISLGDVPNSIGAKFETDLLQSIFVSIDCIVLGNDAIALPIEGDDYQSPFYLDGKRYVLNKVSHGTAFGVGLIAINEAINWIELTPINWGTVIAHGLGWNIKPKD